MVRRSELDVARRGALLREKQDKTRATHIVAKFLGLVDGDDSRAEISVADGDPITVQCAPGRYVVGAFVSVLVDVLGRPVRVVSAVSDRPEHLVDPKVKPAVRTAMKDLQPVAAAELPPEELARIAAVEEELVEAKAEYDQMFEARDAAAAEAMETLTELDSKFMEIEAVAGNLAGIRADVTAATDKATAAQAEADALRVEADRLASELGATDARAIAAKEAADKAQAEADELRAELAQAIEAAQKAQATADQATLDARDAHNAAVEARENAESAANRLTELYRSGSNLLGNGDFTSGMDFWTGAAGMDIVSDTEVESSPGTGFISTELPFQVVPGHVYRLATRIKGKDAGVRIYLQLVFFDADNEHISGRYAMANRELSTEYETLQGTDITAPDNAQLGSISFWTNHTTGTPAGSGAGSIVDFVSVIDVTADLAAAQAIRDAEQAARDAAAAQKRADAAYTLAEKKADKTQVDAIVASVNGKNSITISTGEPSGSGVAVGDLWWRRDSSNLVYGQWTWNGSSWIPSQVRNEMIAGLDVHKLQVTGSAVVAEAVINKLWIDGLAAKSIAASRIVVTTVENMIPGVEYISDAAARRAAMDGGDTTYNGWGFNTTHPSIWIQGRKSLQINAGIPIKKGTRYRFSFDAMASVDGTVTFWQFLRANEDGTISGDGAFTGWEKRTGTWAASYPASNQVVNKSWQTYTGEATATEDGIICLQCYGNHSNGVDNPTGYQWFRNLKLQPMVGAVLIEDGAVIADKISAGAIKGHHLAIVPKAGTGGLQMDAQGLDIIPSEAEAGTAISLRADLDNWISFAKGGLSTFAVSSDGDLSTQNVSVNNELVYRGEELSDILAGLPRGIIGRSMLMNNVITDGEWVELCSVTFDVVPGRMYRAIGVINSTSTAAINQGIGFKFAHTGTFSDVQMVPTNFADQFTSGTQVMTFSAGDIGSSGGEVTLGFFGKSYDGRQIAFHGRSVVPGSMRSCHLHVEDIGIAVDTIQQENNSSKSAAPIPTKTKKYYTKKFPVSWVKNWRTNGSAYTWGGRENDYYFQGTQAGTGYALRSMAGFGSGPKSFIGSGTVTACRLVMPNSHAYSAGSAMNAVVGYHAAVNAPASYQSPAGSLGAFSFTRGQTRSIRFGSNVGTLLKNGSFAALTLSGTGSSNYGYFSKSGTYLEITVYK